LAIVAASAALIAGGLLLGRALTPGPVEGDVVYWLGSVA
jgi:hypothetical protein